EAPVEHARATEPETETDYEAYDAKDDVEIEDLVRFDEEIEAATLIRNEAEDLVRDFMTNVAMGQAIEPQKIHKTVESVIESAFRNQDAITSLTRLKNADEYTYGHCVNVCILSVAIARRMGFDKEALQKLGVGAMLHDVGKALVPEDILKKAGPLSDTEFENMKTHTTLGIEYLKEMPEIPEASLHVVAQHHEKFNGTGYPSHKEGERIHIFARIAAVADVYDAMTSTRCYQQGMLPDIALQKIYMLREKQFEPTLVERLIKCLGIYPIGTVVELNTGEVAVVKGANHSNPLQPKISMLINAQGEKFKKAFQIDLKNASSKWVVSSKNPVSMGLDIDDIIA
ncbi:MAG: HD-GYP domain-containing protein, partial [Proteobacteria bacterium]|nr:HD-GYP domain-containing protein [Pseudomonadota bacterium]